MLLLIKKGLVKTKLVVNLSLNMDDLLKKLVNVYMNIQNGYSDSENIKDSSKWNLDVKFECYFKIR